MIKAFISVLAVPLRHYSDPPPPPPPPQRKQYTQLNITPLY